jgi:hypothetical protein
MKRCPAQITLHNFGVIQREVLSTKREIGKEAM